MVRRCYHKNPAATAGRKENGELGSQAGPRAVGHGASSQATKNERQGILGKTIASQPGEDTKDDRHAGTVGRQATSGATAPMGRRQKTMNSVGSKTEDLLERHIGNKVRMATKKQQRGGQEG
jgi:hypothetical protein